MKYLEKGVMKIKKNHDIFKYFKVK